MKLPALRERVEEIPWLIQHAVGAAGREVDVHASFVEACISRPWPGNVRELLGAVRRGLHAAREGKLLSVEHLDETAGAQASISPSPVSSSPVTSSVSSPPRSTRDEPGSQSNIRIARGNGAPLRESDAASERERMIDALKTTGGNQTTAATLLGMSRRTFIRRLEELDVPRPRVLTRG